MGFQGHDELCKLPRKNRFPGDVFILRFFYSEQDWVKLVTKTEKQLHTLTKSRQCGDFLLEYPVESDTLTCLLQKVQASFQKSVHALLLYGLYDNPKWHLVPNNTGKVSSQLSLHLLALALLCRSGHDLVWSSLDQQEVFTELPSPFDRFVWQLLIKALLLLNPWQVRCPTWQL